MAPLPKFLGLVMLTVVCAAGISVAGTASGVDVQITTTTTTTGPGRETASMPAEPSPSPPPTAEPATVDSENKFLKYLFNKYGSKGVISFEGLEHLMHSLGLGGLNFPGSHTLKEHRPEGYDFGEYDVYDGVNQQDPAGHIHPHQHEHDATAEPPVITFASAPTSSSTSGDQHHHEHETHHEHVHSGEDHEHNHGHPEVDERRASTVSSGNSTATPTRTEVPPRSVTAFREANPSDDHVWQEIIFKDMHDPRHRHPRNKNVPYCLSPRSIVHLVMDEPMLAAKQDSFRRARSLAHKHAHGPAGHHDHEDDEGEDHDHGDARIEITPSEFKDLCPAFLVQLDQRACSQKLQAEANPHREKKQPFTQAWIYASACVLIISLCGLVGVAMVPLAKSIAYDDILRFLIALGVGTLSGDALMHLLPHALLPHDDHHSSHDDDGDDHHGHEHGSVGSDHHHHDGHSAETRAMWLCLCAFGTAFFMYSLEMILPLFRGGDGHSHHGHSHGGGHPQSNRVEPVHTAGNGAAHRGEDIELDMSEARSPTRKDKEEGAMLEKKNTKSKPMAAVAFMVVLGDGLHNITDGLAIGAAFAADPVTGLAISFAILCHELPHELGDFALLLQTGVSIRRAIFLNIVSSVLSFIGMALGLLLTGMHESVVSWIYAGTAGTFLYIALADLVPEMRNDLARSEQKVKVILIQMVGLTLGAIIMLLIALNETSLRMLFN